MTKNLARRFQQADSDFTRCRMKRLQEKPGNPYGIEIRSFGRATAFMASGLSRITYFNKVAGLDLQREDLIDEIIYFYRKHEASCQFEIVPCDLNEKFGHHLNAHGFYQSKFHSTLYRLPVSTVVGSAANIDVKGLNSNEDLDLYVDLNLDGWAIPEKFKAQARGNMLLSYSHPDFKHYIAYVDGIPASIATLYITNGLGYYANAATIPDHRGKGCQKALLNRIISDAALASCEVIVGLAGFGSVSQRNMERMGMSIAYTQAIWIDSAG